MSTHGFLSLRLRNLSKASPKRETSFSNGLTSFNLNNFLMFSYFFMEGQGLGSVFSFYLTVKFNNGYKHDLNNRKKGQ